MQLQPRLAFLDAAEVLLLHRVLPFAPEDCLLSRAVKVSNCEISATTLEKDFRTLA